MGPEKLINEFVERMRTAAGANLLSAILYGSAAAGDYVADYSDVNLLCVLRETSFAAIEALAPAIGWWAKQKHRVPLLMSANEMRRSADVFSIEFLDMRRHYRVLWGEDFLKTLEIPMRLHRAQVEYELREKTILLRQRLLVVSGNSSANQEAKWDLLLQSLSAFGTLFRHALIALGGVGESAESKREAAVTLARQLGIDTSVFAELLDIRERRKDRKTVRVDEMFARYMKLVDEVTASVDKMLDPAA
jgi:predicted nucleotidyltransferase